MKLKVGFLPSARPHLHCGHLENEPGDTISLSSLSPFKNKINLKEGEKCLTCGLNFEHVIDMLVGCGPLVFSLEMYWPYRIRVAGTIQSSLMQIWYWEVSHFLSQMSADPETHCFSIHLILLPQDSGLLWAGSWHHLWVCEKCNVLGSSLPCEVRTFIVLRCPNDSYAYTSKFEKCCQIIKTCSMIIIVEINREKQKLFFSCILERAAEGW